MTYENIKSLILVILVCFSVLLTWSIWTYQPNLETMKKTKTVQEVAISEKKDAEKIVKPDRVIYHYSKDKHFGTTDAGEIDKIISEISRWNFTDFIDVTSEIKNYPSFIHNSGNAVILFPDSIPIDFYRTIIDMKEKKIPDFYFDRIVIDTEGIQKDQGFVYFISSEKGQAFRSQVPASFVQSFYNGFFNNAEYSLHYAKYFPFKSSSNRVIYMPEDAPKMIQYQYLSKPLESEKFKNALFRDPTVVKKSYQQSGEEYTNGSSLMRVNNDRNTLSYVNPVGGSESQLTSKSLLKRSIDFVNDHGGWTDNYRFVEMDETSRQVLFRIYDHKGYPIFSEGSGISEIRETWGQSEIYKYFRSNFLMELRMEDTEVSLPSGQKAIELLELKGLELANLQDMMLGYSMEKDSRLVYLEPSWFYKYNGSWNQLSVDETMGGANRGLE
ncbi:YycH family regulatory protein [Bacillus sp. FJAT-29937]|uniref:YycH family regulatory protein n=1 Tax=Bacillus sp. FJAT-29937 TaxID=1720553 RepID=UPI000834ACC2|nr:two-component system activity regulator YycH [Bacillus sp. FJAT-29937]